MAGFQSLKTGSGVWLFTLKGKICPPCQFLSHQYCIAILLSWECQSKYIESSFTQTKIFSKQNKVFNIAPLGCSEVDMFYKICFWVVI